MLSDLTSIYAEAWKASFLAANPFHSVHWREEDLVHVHAGLTAACAERDARIAELEAEVKALTQDREVLALEGNRLTQQLAEARKDADRYQWLCGFSSVSMPELTWGRRAGIPKNKLDAAIDAAIKEQT